MFFGKKQTLCDVIAEDAFVSGFEAFLRDLDLMPVDAQSQSAVKGMALQKYRTDEVPSASDIRDLGQGFVDLATLTAAASAVKLWADAIRAAKELKTEKKKESGAAAIDISISIKIDRELLKGKGGDEIRSALAKRLERGLGDISADEQ